MPRTARIRRSDEIRALLERGKRKRTKHLDVFLAPSPASFCRLGTIVPKLGRGTVDRNAVKRRIREAGRREVLPDLSRRGLAVDVLVRARKDAYHADFVTLAGELRKAVEELCSGAS